MADWTHLYATELEQIAMTAGDDAALLWVLALGKCALLETDGFIAKGMPERLCPTKTRSRISALVREGWWQVRSDGWQMDWSKRTSREDLDRTRELARKRKAKQRNKPESRSASRVTHGGSHTAVTRQEVEEELEEAAAAASSAPAGAPPPLLPPAVEILKTKLDAARLVVRWDKLDPARLAEVEALVELHGDGPLVKSALAAYRPASPPAFAQAWLEAWRALPAPGEPLRLVAPPCPTHGGPGTVDRCNACAADAKAISNPTTARSRLSRKAASS